MDSATTVQTRNNTPAPPPMRPRVASMQHMKPRVGSNSSKDSGEFFVALNLTYSIVYSLKRV